MDVGMLIATAAAAAVPVLMLWLHTAASIARNAREVAELRGRIAAMKDENGRLAGQVANAFQRLGGVDRTANQTAGEMRQVRDTLAVVHERLIGRGEGGP